MLLSPVTLPGYYFILHGQRAELTVVQDQLDQLQSLQPPPDCLPEWRGPTKDGYIEKLGDMTALLASVRAEVTVALAEIDIALAELADE